MWHFLLIDNSGYGKSIYFIHAGCLLSALGAGMPYNREKNESLVCSTVRSRLWYSLGYVTVWVVASLGSGSLCCCSLGSLGNGSLGCVVAPLDHHV